MFLTEANVLHYLVERNFADLEAVVDGQFSVRDLSYRNYNFGVTCGRREYLVKQPKKWTPAGRGSIDSEASFYWHVRTDASFLPLRGLVPESYGYDPQHSILILKFLPGQIALHHAPDPFSPESAGLVATAMATLHREMRSAEISRLFPGTISWFLSIHEADPDSLEDAQEGQRELVRLVRNRPAFGRALESLRSEWHAQALIHGDWKLSNCLISAARDRLTAVDWECATWGDPLYDAGTVLQSYWSFWVRSPEKHPIEEIRPALSAFMETYAHQTGVAVADILLPVIRFAGARMVQTAYESLMRADKITADAVRLAQASLNILTRPERAAEDLLGVKACAAS
jgi:aminoglycoside phosphotransferase (APT) family kinase protein